jgi:hypothetical protein
VCTALSVCDSTQSRRPSVNLRHDESFNLCYRRHRLHRAVADPIERWADFVRERSKDWKDVFIYFKHEEAGAGPKFAKQMMEILAA